jgi:hypothetical protein
MQKTIYLPDDDTWDRIAAAAARAGESISEYLRRAAEDRMTAGASEPART